MPGRRRTYKEPLDDGSSSSSNDDDDLYPAHGVPREDSDEDNRKGIPVRRYRRRTSRRRRSRSKRRSKRRRSRSRKR